MQQVVRGTGVGALLASLLVACSPGPLPESFPTAPPSSNPSPTTTPSLPSPEPKGEEIGLGIGGSRFEDRFAGPEINAQVWKLLLGSGKSNLGKDGLRLFVEGRQTSFPYMYSKEPIIPFKGPWAIEWSFHLKGITSRLQFALDYLPPEGFDAPVLSAPFMSIGRTNETIRVTSSGMGGVFYSESLPLDSHPVVRVEGDGVSSSTMFINGKAFRGARAYYQPLRFWMGSNPPNNTLFQDWGEVRLKYVVAGRLDRSIAEFFPDQPATADASATPVALMPSPRPSSP